MSDWNSVRVLVNKYAEVKSSPGGDLLQWLSPVSEKVATIGHHGGDDFIGTLSAEDVYHYHMLIRDLAKLYYGVQETEESSVEGTVAARHATFRQNYDMRRTEREAAPVEGASLLQFSEPLEGPSTSSFQPTARSAISQLYASQFHANAPLPVILEDTPLIIPPTSARRSPPPGVMDFVRHSQQATNEQQAFDAPIVDLFNLELNEEELREIEEIFGANRRQRIETIEGRRRTGIVAIRPELNMLRPPTVTTAEAVTSHDAYLDAEVMDYESIDTLRNVERNVVNIPENAIELIVSSLQRRRVEREERRLTAIPEMHTQSSLLERGVATESQAGISSINMPEQLPQAATEAIAPRRLSYLPEEPIQQLPQPADPYAFPQLEIPPLIERLVETSPMVSPINLRERNENRDAFYAEPDFRPPRRRRRRRRLDQERSGSVSPVPMRRPRRSHRPPNSQSFPPEMIQSLVVELGPHQVMQQEIPQEQSSLLRKFKRWQEAILSKTDKMPWRHQNLMTELKKMEQLLPETQNVLVILAAKKYTPFTELVGINRKKSAQRFTILLELNRRGVAILKRNESCVVLGVENPYFDDNQERASHSLALN